jgi:peptide chain release factor 1
MTLEKYEKIEERYAELEQLLADPQVISDQSRYAKLAKEYSGITVVVTTFRTFKEVCGQIEETEALLNEKHDKEFEALAKVELEDLMQKKQDLLARLNDLTNPKKQEKDRDLIIEIRAGTGGQEASLFAADLYRMYTKYADQKGWTVEALQHFDVRRETREAETQDSGNAQRDAEIAGFYLGDEEL